MPYLPHPPPIGGPGLYGAPKMNKQVHLRAFL